MLKRRIIDLAIMSSSDSDDDIPAKGPHKGTEDQASSATALPLKPATEASPPPIPVPIAHSVATDGEVVVRKKDSVQELNETETPDPFAVTSKRFESTSSNPMDIGRAAPSANSQQQVQQQVPPEQVIANALESVPKTAARRPPTIQTLSGSSGPAASTSQIALPNLSTSNASESLLSPQKAPATVRVYKKAMAAGGASPTASSGAPRLNVLPSDNSYQPNESMSSRVNDTSDNQLPMGPRRALHEASSPHFMSNSETDASSRAGVLPSAPHIEMLVGTIKSENKREIDPSTSAVNSKTVTLSASELLRQEIVGGARPVDDAPSLTFETNQTFPLPSRRRKSSTTSVSGVAASSLTQSDSNNVAATSDSGAGILLPTSNRFTPPPESLIVGPTTVVESDDDDQGDDITLTHSKVVIENVSLPPRGVKESLEPEDRRSASPVILNSTLTAADDATTSSRNASPHLWRPTPGGLEISIVTAETIVKESDSEMTDEDVDDIEIEKSMIGNQAEVRRDAPLAITTPPDSVRTGVQKEIDDALAAARARYNATTNLKLPIAMSVSATRLPEYPAKVLTTSSQALVEANDHLHYLNKDDVQTLPRHPRNESVAVILDQNTDALSRLRDSMAGTIPDINSQEIELKLIIDRIAQDSAQATNWFSVGEENASTFVGEGLNDEEGELFNSQWGYPNVNSVASENVKQRSLLLLGQTSLLGRMTKAARAGHQLQQQRFKATSTLFLGSNAPSAKVDLLIEQRRAGGQLFESHDHVWTEYGLELTEKVRQREKLQNIEDIVEYRGNSNKQLQVTEGRVPMITNKTGREASPPSASAQLHLAASTSSTQNPLASGPSTPNEQPSTTASLLALREKRMSLKSKAGSDANEKLNTAMEATNNGPETESETAPSTPTVATGATVMKTTTKVGGSSVPVSSSLPLYPMLTVIDDLVEADRMKLLQMEESVSTRKSKPVVMTKRSASKPKRSAKQTSTSASQKGSCANKPSDKPKRVAFDNNNYGVGSRTAIGLPKVDEMEAAAQVHVESQQQQQQYVRRRFGPAVESEMAALKQLLSVKPTRGLITNEPTTEDEFVIPVVESIPQKYSPRASPSEAEATDEFDDPKPREVHQETTRSVSAHFNLYEPALVNEKRSSSPKNGVGQQHLKGSVFVSSASGSTTKTPTKEKGPEITNKLLQRLAAAAATLSPLPKSLHALEADNATNTVSGNSQTEIIRLVHNPLSAFATSSTVSQPRASVTDALSPIVFASSSVTSPISPPPRKIGEPIVGDYIKSPSEEANRIVVEQLQSALGKLNEEAAEAKPTHFVMAAKRQLPPPEPSPPNPNGQPSMAPLVTNPHYYYSRYYSETRTEVIGTVYSATSEEKENAGVSVGSATSPQPISPEYGMNNMKSYFKNPVVTSKTTIGGGIPLVDSAYNSANITATPPPRRRAPPPPPTFD